MGGLQNQPFQGNVEHFSPATWAYLGDAVYELFIRTQCLFPPSRLQHYHQRVVKQVCAEAQAQMMGVLANHLTLPELEIAKRGRNAASGKPKRVKLRTYQQATGLETLLGYLYLTDPQRLDQVLEMIRQIREQASDLPDMQGAAESAASTKTVFRSGDQEREATEI